MRREILMTALVLIAGRSTLAADWPAFLGADARATSPEQVPTTWSDEEHLAWKATLPGSGSSSPIVVGDRVIVTCYVESNDTPRRSVLCFNKQSGQELWQAEYPIDYREDRYQGFITEHGYASNTPASDGENIFVFFGKGGVHALSIDGKKLWSVDVGKESSNRQWGSGASVLLHKDLVIINAAEESQTLFALDKKTGAERWKQEAAMLELTYGTPRIVSLTDGRSELVISVPDEVWGLDAETGKFKWYVQTPMTGNVSPSVIVDKQTIYSFGGYRGSGSIALRAGGLDDASKQNTIWTNRTSSYVATPLLHEGKFYWIDDRGIAYCTSAENGDVIYRSRVEDVGSGRPVYASPVLFGGNIYVVTRRNGTIVYKPGDTFEPIAQNRFEGDETDFNASPAVSDGKIYLRSDQTLYCIE